MRNLFNKLILILIFPLTIAALFLTCANQVPPTGGPVDNIPPEVISAFPAPDSTGIQELQRIELEFSENIEKSSITGQVWMVPMPEKEFRLEWKGNRKLYVILQDTLLKDQTYILTVGTGVKDWRGNRLEKPFVLPFSTGARIDQGSISGQVFTAKPEDVLIYAYLWRQEFPDTLVAERKPLYYTQAGKDGTYELGYLKPARYRVFALIDNNGDGVYSPGVDRIGVPFSDLVIDSQQVAYKDINFHLVREDTTAPRFLQASVRNRNRVDLLFTEPLSEKQFFKALVRDSLSGDTLPVLSAQLLPSDKKRVVLFTATQIKDRKYIGWLNAVEDTVGNITRTSTIPFNFQGTDKEDTTRFRLISLSPDSGRRNVPYGFRVQLNFPLPVDSQSLKAAFTLQYDDSLRMDGRWEFNSLFQPRFVPDSIIHQQKTFLIRLQEPAIYSVTGDTLGDSILVSPFTTYDFAELGEISGQIMVPDSTWQQVILDVFPLNGKGFYRRVFPVNAEYLFPELPDGRYRLRATVDRNKNGIPDRGSIVPFQYAEPFVFYPDTIKVRKRWTTQGIDIQFKFK